MVNGTMKTIILSVAMSSLVVLIVVILVVIMLTVVAPLKVLANCYQNL
jgi:hypothetical protein